MGDFLKELDLTEGRCTGIPTIQEELAKNGSPRAFIETDEDRSYFLMYIPVHEGCGNVVTLKEQKEDLHKDCTKVTQNLPKDYPKITQRLPKDCPKVAQSTLELIIQTPSITVKQLSEDLALSEKTIKNRLALLKKEGFIVRVGSKTSGYWKVIGKMEE